jgi:hypothetical protein
MQFNGIEVEGDVADPSANEREERNAAASSISADSRCGDGDAMMPLLTNNQMR